ncbi:MAG: leucine--tRNA ligase [Oscillospiraceae bacterium]|nr:leucine--tRNA ligase [Oscillospiraceae bacterium]
MKNYDYTAIEQKWQAYWDKHETFKATDCDGDSGKGGYFILVEFPYPSGQGLHIGHPRPYTAMDILARYRRLDGYNVLYPMGWDAFGLPTENFAIKNKIHPAIVTADNIKNFTRQAKAIGFSFDWSREINTTDPAYYKWTQWIFLQLFKKGLAYKKEMAVNWCTSCKVVLANEEVVDNACERCHSEVVRKVKNQWMLKITEYAQRLIDDLADVDYPARVKSSQINWIGRSTGAEVIFETKCSGETEANHTMRVYTTRPDTLFGATYMVISPEHPYIEKWTDKLANMGEVRAYQEKSAKKSDFERTELAKDKTGVKLDGVFAINPVNGAQIPIFISDYVLMSYGTGAIMAVPAHDTRDHAFAKAFNLPIIEVVRRSSVLPSDLAKNTVSALGREQSELNQGNVQSEAFTDCDSGVMVNSDFLDGLSVEDAKVKIIEWLAQKGLGEPKVNFKLRDWVFSRQRYWGEPIPLVDCPKCGWVSIPESELPLKLPEVESYMPTDNGESPLAALDDFVNTTCPECGGAAKRETDTMPQWAGSSWYYLRYCDPDNTDALISPDKLAYWTKGGTKPIVDWYNGGMEHTTLHLLYSRFWHKFLYDIGVVEMSEPYAKRTAHGMILGDDGQKMSKSRGNVINPDDILRDYGADALRLYEMFVGDFEKAAPWAVTGIKGCKRFLDRVWNLQENVIDGDKYRPELRSAFHKTIKKVGHDIETLKFNTAIAALMALLNEVTATGAVNKAELRTFLILLNPFAPHITEELYEVCELGGVVNAQTWCAYDEALCKDNEVEIVVQINGKVRAKAIIESGCDKAKMLQIAKDALGSTELAGKTVVKEIVVPDKLVNIVAR